MLDLSTKATTNAQGVIEKQWKNLNAPLEKGETYTITVKLFDDPIKAGDDDGSLDSDANNHTVATTMQMLPPIPMNVP